MAKQVVNCPECKFPNLAGAKVCLTCKSPLDGAVSEEVLGEEASDEDDVLETGVMPSPADTTLDVATPHQGNLTRPFDLDRDAGDHPPPMHNPAADPPTERTPATNTTRAVVRRGRGPRDGSGPPQRPSQSERVWLSWEEQPTLAWLSCEPLPPIPLGPKKEVSMGRGKECDLLLPHPTVSRIHAVIAASGADLSIEDRSKFGTFVNGSRVEQAPLRIGDRITIGPYEVRQLPPDSGEEAGNFLAEETRELDLAPFQKGNQDAELMGTLDRVSLLEILQGFEFNRKTGTLRVTAGSIGLLTVISGQPQFATFGELRDDDAVLAMLDQHEGSFAFFSEPVQGERTMDITLTGLLLEHSRRQDETGL